MESRKRNSMLNTVFGIGSQLIILLFTIVSRKIFTDLLGADYLGLNSLFANIVLMLSLTELGLGSSMVYFLYKPLAEKNDKMVRIYQNYFRNIYNWIGVILTLVGIIISFFIGFISTDIPFRELQIYFILYMLGTTVTYFLSYKKNLLLADQKNRIISVAHTIAKIAFEIAQIILLLQTGSYFLYLLLFITFNFSENLLVSLYVDRKYPHLKGKERETLTRDQKIDVRSKVRDLFVQNISGFFISSTDNLLISTFVSTAATGMYANYIIIINVLKTMFSQIFSSFTTSFGNLHATSDLEHGYHIYKNAQFLAFWFLSFTSITFFVCIQDFMSVWMGSEYVLSLSIPFLICASYYVYGISVPSLSVQNALGLYNADKNIMVIQAVINFILSVVLVNVIGIGGVVLGTVVSTMCLPMISKPYIIHNQVFGRSPKAYYLELIKGFVLTLVVGVGLYVATRYISTPYMLLTVVIEALVCVVVINGLYIALFYRSEEFKYYYRLVEPMVKKVLRRG